MSLSEQILRRIFRKTRFLYKFKKCLFDFLPNSCQLQRLLVLIQLLISYYVALNLSLKLLYFLFIIQVLPLNPLFYFLEMKFFHVKPYRKYSNFIMQKFLLTASIIFKV